MQSSLLQDCNMLSCKEVSSLLLCSLSYSYPLSLVTCAWVFSLSTPGIFSLYFILSLCLTIENRICYILWWVFVILVFNWRFVVTFMLTWCSLLYYWSIPYFLKFTYGVLMSQLNFIYSQYICHLCNHLWKDNEARQKPLKIFSSMILMCRPPHIIADPFSITCPVCLHFPSKDCFSRKDRQIGPQHPEVSQTEGDNFLCTVSNHPRSPRWCTFKAVLGSFL